VARVDFWDVFWLLFIFSPLAFMWGFVIVDIFRRDDIGGVMKAVWLLAVFVLPFLGSLIYLLFRPAGATAAERVMIDDANRQFVQRYSTPTTADQIGTLADLHDRGKLTDAEFAAEKSRLLGRQAGANSITTTSVG
jgi:hypothetical protein